MKAAICPRYGPPEVIELRQIAKPEPRPNEVLIAMRATTVTAGDWRVRSMSVPAGFGLIGRLALGVSGPRQPILGTELAGRIEAVGSAVTRFAPGDDVLAFSGTRMGCHAEHTCMPEDAAIVPKPGNLSYEEAACLCFGGTTALDFFRRGKLAKGERLLVNGASGNVGTSMVQLAKHLGAHVTGVCSGANASLMRSLGADAVIDYTTVDFCGGAETYDVIADCAGTAPFARCKRALAPGGRLLQILGSLPDLLKAPLAALSGKKVIAGPAAERPEDVRLLAELAEKGVLRAVIDRRYPLDQIVEAHRYVETGRKKGSVVITLPT